MSWIREIAVPWQEVILIMVIGCAVVSWLAGLAVECAYKLESVIRNYMDLYNAPPQILDSWEYNSQLPPELALEADNEFRASTRKLEEGGGEGRVDAATAQG